MSTAATADPPKTAREDRAEHGVQDVRIVAIDVDAPTGGDGGPTGGAGGDPPIPPPARTDWSEKEPAWARCLIAGLLVIAFGFLWSAIEDVWRRAKT